MRRRHATGVFFHPHNHTTMCNINALTTVPCAGNAVGVKGKGYMAPAGEFASWPAYLSTTTPGDTVKLTGNFSFVATSDIGYFREFPCLIEKGSYTVTAVGGVGSKTFEEKFTYVIPGVDAAQLEHIKDLINIPGVWLCIDKNNVTHVLGSKDDPAYVESVEGTTGAAAGDERIITITIRAISARPTVYTGTVNTTPNA